LLPARVLQLPEYGGTECPGIGVKKCAAAIAMFGNGVLLRDERKTKEELIRELVEVRQRLSSMTEDSENRRRTAVEIFRDNEIGLGRAVVNYAAQQLADHELECRIKALTHELESTNDGLKAATVRCRKAEAAIRRHKGVLSNFMESLTHPFYVVDADDYSIFMANTASGFSASSAQMTCYQLTHGASRPCGSDDHPCPLETVKTTRRPVVVHHTHTDPQGNVRTVQVNAFPVLDHAGRVVHVIEHCLDVTKLVRAEEALYESYRRFRTIVDSAGDWIFIKDVAGIYTLVNPAMTECLGVPADALLGKTDDVLVGRQLRAQLRDIDSRVLKGETIEREYTFTVNGAGLTLLDTRFPLCGPDGEVVGICGIARNITDRKTALGGSARIAREFPSDAMRRTLEAARLAARTSSVVLLMGESGSGKDYLARFIHDNSERSAGPFHAINCAALPSEIAESELFGYEGGAFTGARRHKRGLLELAEGGTLLLNEIGELSLALQAKLLTFMDSRSFVRVGGDRMITVNARLVAATNRDLEDEVRHGRFRADLFYRLNVFSIVVPPLRDRIEDLPVLVEKILVDLVTQLQLPRAPRIDAPSMEMLCRYAWPGNVRELRNVLERELILSEGKPFDLGHLQRRKKEDRPWNHRIEFPAGRSFDEMIRDAKCALIQEALRLTGGRKQEAAVLLGISRFALTRQMVKYGCSGK